MVSSFQGVGIEEFHCIQRCPHFKVLEWRSSTVYRGVLVSGCWNRRVPLYTVMSSFQRVGSTVYVHTINVTSNAYTGINPHDNPDFNPELSFNFVPVDTITSNFLEFTPDLLSFIQCNMKQQITSAASSLHDAHARCLQTLILYAHDLTRDVIVTPKRIKYARTKEEELYTQLIDLASRKQSEIKELVHQAIADATDDIVTQVNHIDLILVGN